MNTETNNELDGIDSTTDTQSNVGTDSETGTTAGDSTQASQNTENGDTTAGDATTATDEQPTNETIGDDSQNASNQSNGNIAFGTVGLISAIFSVMVVILTLISLWKIFEKAGEKGFKILIPIYNLFILLKIAFSKNDLSNNVTSNDSFNFGDTNALNSFNNDYTMDSNNSNNGFDMSGHLNSEYNNNGIDNMYQSTSGFEPNQNMNQMNPGFDQNMEQVNNGFIPNPGNENISEMNQENGTINNMPSNMMGTMGNNNGFGMPNGGIRENNNQPYNNGPIPINDSQNMTKQCPNCHAPVPLNLVICPNCGANINR